MSHVVSPQNTEGGRQKLRTADENLLEVLQQILSELKIIRIHFESITDEDVKEEDT